MNTASKKGVSVILCCYNSTARIKDTLHALAKQQVPVTIPWEIVLVDNASTDDSAAAAASFWKMLDTTVTLTIVYEPSPGLANARKKGIQTATCSYLLFCDDDTWLKENYVAGVFNILDANPAVAACGGMGIPVFETAKPHWFDEYSEAFALGSQEINAENGRILNLYGAGLGVNKKMIEQLENTRFRSTLQGRVKDKLSSSEDTELTYAFVIMGYQLYYTGELQFFHYLPKERLTLAYLRKLFEAFGTDGPVRNLYYSIITDRVFHKKIRNWNFHLLLSVYRLVKYAIVPPKKYGRRIYINWSIAYIRGLFAVRKNYRDLTENIIRIKNSNQATPLQLSN